jgi:hypothetical protein
MRSEDATCQSIVRMSIDHLINNQHERRNKKNLRPSFFKYLPSLVKFAKKKHKYVSIMN